MINLAIPAAAFLSVSSFVVLIWLLFSKGRMQVDERIAQVTPRFSAEQLQSESETSTLSRLGKLFVPKDDRRRSKLKDRILQAGLYRNTSIRIFLGIKILLMVCPIAVGMVLCSVGLISLDDALLYGAVAGLLGTVAPALWLSYVKTGRQKHIRRALPDALDVIVVCLEGGLSLPAAFARVAAELGTAHPLLADEMLIMKREIQLGRTTGQALRQFANRFDIEEIRSMASVVYQAERFGASVTQALQVHADTLRLKRYQRAEALAQKAPVKLIFPTVLCIFPALYIVLMTPAFIQVFEALNEIGS
jgi:tight adherence protein C